MAENLNQRYGIGRAATSHEIDEGLRAHMLGVYNYMASGVLLTGVISMLVFQWAAGNPAVYETLFFSPLRWVIMLSPLAIVMVMSFAGHKLSTFALQACYWAFAALMGLSLSWIFFAYTGGSIARTPVQPNSG